MNDLSRSKPRPLRPYQERAIEALKRSIASGHRRPMLQLPTGAGKTLLAAHIVSSGLGKTKRIAFVVPKLSLIDQTVAAFEAEGISAVGVMQGRHERTDETQPVQVCSAQTLARRDRPAVDLVIVDEAHELYKSVLSWIEDPDCASLIFIGLSATPWSPGLADRYDDLVVAATAEDLIRDGYLCDFVAFAPSQPDLSGVSTVAGEFHQGQLAHAMDTRELVGDIVETWLRRGEARPTLAYCVDLAHARSVRAAFLAADVVAEYIDGNTSRQDRAQVFDRFRAGETKVICNVGTLTVGVDLPLASCIVDAKPTRSKMLFVQTIGRGLRTAPGKDRLVILDHAGNHLRHGFVTQVRGKLRREKAEKDGEEKGSAADEIKLCPECRAVLSRFSERCGQCGAVIPGKRVMVAEGELIELKPPDKSTFYAELRLLGAARGYKPGWPDHVFRERFGVWPKDIEPRDVRLVSTLTLKWIAERQRSYAARAAQSASAGAES
jgi:superfamily II DNA or RNA helicase